jgi:5-deoxy-glucuronate isomerase
MGIIKSKLRSDSYTPVVTVRPAASNSELRFGIIRLSIGESYENDEQNERAILLISGSVWFEWDEHRVLGTRLLWWKESGYCLHVPAGMRIKITGEADKSELLFYATPNENPFCSHLYYPEEFFVVEQAKGILGGAMERINRNIISRSTEASSHLILAECQSKPGRWCGFPDHFHPQPEIYYYKFYPADGFALQRLGGNVYVVEDGDTVVITNSQIHPNCTSPDCLMNYVWCICDDPENPYRPYFSMEHTWVPGCWVSYKEKMEMPP